MPIAEINEQEWAEYLTAVLKRLDTLIASTNDDLPLHQYAHDAAAALGTLLDYFIVSVEQPTTPTP